ncbi:MAG: purine-nucleoside phosphorylase [Bacteroidales bacterium]|nr:purine-nucleoside phosphorylase [Bacteroidales bacterium]
MADERIERIKNAAEFIKARLDGRKPEIGIVLGSGLGKLGDYIEDATVIPYKQIPGFPVSTATGHKGNLIIGNLGGKTIVAMQGRFHYYEGYPMELVTLPIRVMSSIGVKVLLVSNAAGGLNQSYKVGDLMIIKDHINTIPNPLIGPNMNDFGPRFPDMTRPYDFELIEKVENIARRLGHELQKGVYFATTGPTYETPAEVRFYRMAGGDAVGMSTVPEVIVARHCGIRVFGMSVITNSSNDSTKSDFVNDGEDVVKQADIAATKMIAIFTELIKEI